MPILGKLAAHHQDRYDLRWYAKHAISISATGCDLSYGMQCDLGYDGCQRSVELGLCCGLLDNGRQAAGYRSGAFDGVMGHAMQPSTEHSMEHSMEHLMEHSKEHLMEHLLTFDGAFDGTFDGALVEPMEE